MFNNCYANYGTTNAREIADLLAISVGAGDWPPCLRRERGRPDRRGDRDRASDLAVANIDVADDRVRPERGREGALGEDRNAVGRGPDLEPVVRAVGAVARPMGDRTRGGQVVELSAVDRLDAGVDELGRIIDQADRCRMPDPATARHEPRMDLPGRAPFARIQAASPTDTTSWSVAGPLPVPVIWIATSLDRRCRRPPWPSP